MVDEPAPQSSITKRKTPPGTDFFRAIFERSSNSRQRTGTAFERDVWRSRALLSRFTQLSELEEHRGCVNTVCWNKKGDLLLSGSDDCRVCIWSLWGEAKGRASLVKALATGHRRNIFSAQFVPGSGDREVVTCALDRQVRWVDVETGTHSHLATCRQFCSRIAFIPCVVDGDGQSFLTAGQDGKVSLFDLRVRTATELPPNQLLDLSDHGGCTALAFDPTSSGLHFSVGCDDPIVRTFDMRALSKGPLLQYAPSELLPRRAAPPRYHRMASGPSGIVYTKLGELIVNMRGADIYRFDSVNNAIRRSATAATEAAEAAAGMAEEDDDDEAARMAAALPSTPGGGHVHGDEEEERHDGDEGDDDDDKEEEEDDDDEKAAPMDAAVATFERSSRRRPPLFRGAAGSSSSSSSGCGSSAASSSSSSCHDPAAAARRRCSSGGGGGGGGFALESVHGVDTLTHVLTTYSGRVNDDTFAKEVCLLHDDRYVVTGGDCGRVYAWGRESGRLVLRERGDGSIVNCVAPHPSLPLLAVSGIDDDIKLFGLGEGRQAKLPRRVGVSASGREWEAEGWTYDEPDPPPPRVSAQEAADAVEGAARAREAGNEGFRDGDLGEAMGKYAAALDLLYIDAPTADLSVEVTDEAVRVKLNLAAVCLKTGQFRAAVSWCDEVLVVRPKDPKALYRRAKAHHELGNLDEAERTYEEAKECSRSGGSTEGDDPALDKLGSQIMEARRRESQWAAAYERR